ncbi:MAG: sulfoxide reductase heme-binding subunit YedZ [Pseudomonadota bacterium]|nr:sulfoxide reductase heme-binding subunit YedZ [Pseudomonadota bacterium]
MSRIKPFVFLVCLLPFLRLPLYGYLGSLGPDPVAFLIHSTGIWSLVFLLITLSVTPARRIFRYPQLLLLRRMFGQYAFFYGVIHFLLYAYFDQYFSLTAIWRDILDRPFIMTGFTGLALLLPLSCTSTNKWMKRLGIARWRYIHWLIYPSAILSVVHFWLEVKRDIREPLVYAALLGVLLIYRLAYMFYVKKASFLMSLWPKSR